MNENQTDPAASADAATAPATPATADLRTTADHNDDDATLSAAEALLHGEGDDDGEEDAPNLNSFLDDDDDDDDPEDDAELAREITGLRSDLDDRAEAIADLERQLEAMKDLENVRPCYFLTEHPFVSGYGLVLPQPPADVGTDYETAEAWQISSFRIGERSTPTGGQERVILVMWSREEQYTIEATAQPLAAAPAAPPVNTHGGQPARGASPAVHQAAQAGQPASGAGRPVPGQAGFIPLGATDAAPPGGPPAGGPEILRHAPPQGGLAAVTVHDRGIHPIPPGVPTPGNPDGVQ